MQLNYNIRYLRVKVSLLVVVIFTKFECRKKNVTYRMARVQAKLLKASAKVTKIKAMFNPKDCAEPSKPRMYAKLEELCEPLRSRKTCAAASLPSTISVVMQFAINTTTQRTK